MRQAAGLARRTAETDDEMRGPKTCQAIPRTLRQRKQCTARVAENDWVMRIALKLVALVCCGSSPLAGATPQADGMRPHVSARVTHHATIKEL
jgi:hypothetical protein